MKKHGPLPGNRPNPSWTKRYKKSQKQAKAAKKARKKNR